MKLNLNCAWRRKRQIWIRIQREIQRLQYWRMHTYNPFWNKPEKVWIWTHYMELVLFYVNLCHCVGSCGFSPVQNHKENRHLLKRGEKNIDCILGNLTFEPLSKEPKTNWWNVRLWLQNLIHLCRSSSSKHWDQNSLESDSWQLQTR